MSLMHLTKDNYKNFIEENKVALVDFWATWCGPCRMLTPILEEFNTNTGTAVGKVNVDEEEELSTIFNVSAIPTILLYKDGKLVDKKVGYIPLAEIENWLKTYE